MWALIEDGSITKIINKPKGMIIDDIQYSRNIFSLWSVAEKEAKGIYEIVFEKHVITFRFHFHHFFHLCPRQSGFRDKLPEKCHESRWWSYRGAFYHP